MRKFIVVLLLQGDLPKSPPRGTENGYIQLNIARIAKRCPENITSVVKCVKLLV